MSTIYTVRDNLKQTIAGKEAYLAQIKQSNSTTFVKDTISHFLEINITELKVILFDVEKACEEFSLMGWQINPERMGQ